MEIFGTEVPMIAVQLGGFLLGLVVTSIGLVVFGFLTRDRA